MDKRAYRGWFGPRARRRCPHSNLIGIYGDQINAAGGLRLLCCDCGGRLGGPVGLAAMRASEPREDG